MYEALIARNGAYLRTIEGVAGLESQADVVRETTEALAKAEAACREVIAILEPWEDIIYAPAVAAANRDALAAARKGISDA